jgi:hypothetical protein
MPARNHDYIGVPTKSRQRARGNFPGKKPAGVGRGNRRSISPLSCRQKIRQIFVYFRNAARIPSGR